MGDLVFFPTARPGELPDDHPAAALWFRDRVSRLLRGFMTQETIDGLLDEAASEEGA